MYAILPPVKKPLLLLFFCCALSVNSLFSQANDYFMKSADGEVALEVARGEQSVDMALYFSKASGYDCVMVERSADQQFNFSQCKYVKFNNSANDRVVIVQKDTYPMPFANDVFYRLKTISRDGVTRIYPSVRLPGLQNLEN